MPSHRYDTLSELAYEWKRTFYDRELCNLYSGHRKGPAPALARINDTLFADAGRPYSNLLDQSPKIWVTDDFLDVFTDMYQCKDAYCRSPDEFRWRIKSFSINYSSTSWVPYTLPIMTAHTQTHSIVVEEQRDSGYKQWYRVVQTASCIFRELTRQRAHELPGLI